MMKMIVLVGVSLFLSTSMSYAEPASQPDSIKFQPEFKEPRAAAVSFYRALTKADEEAFNQSIVSSERNSESAKYLLAEAQMRKAMLDLLGVAEKKYGKDEFNFGLDIPASHLQTANEGKFRTGDENTEVLLDAEEKPFCVLIKEGANWKVSLKHLPRLQRLSPAVLVSSTKQKEAVAEVVTNFAKELPESEMDVEAAKAALMKQVVRAVFKNRAQPKS